MLTYSIPMILSMPSGKLDQSKLKGVFWIAIFTNAVPSNNANIAVMPAITGWVWAILLLNDFFEQYNLKKAKPHIVLTIIAIIIFLANIIELIEHIRINITIAGYEAGLVNISKINIICLALWFIPYGSCKRKNILYSIKFRK